MGDFTGRGGLQLRVRRSCISSIPGVLPRHAGQNGIVTSVSLWLASSSFSSPSVSLDRAVWF